MSERSTTKIDEKQLRVVQQDCNKKQENVRLKVEEVEYTRKKCWLIFDSLCDFWRKEEDVKDALSESTAANFKVEMLKWQFGENLSLKDEIELALMKLKNESKQLQQQLMDSVSSTVPPIITDTRSTEQLTLEEIQDKWQYFEFSSMRDLSETYNSIGNVLPFGPKPSAYPGHHTFASSVENANVFLKAKLLKVKINRPWFRESLFYDREFKLVSNAN